MLSDEEEIRTLVQTWQSATHAGDVETVLGLMTDDVVFLVPGRPPMRKAEFASLSRVPAGSPRPKFEGMSEIQEIHVSGDMVSPGIPKRVYSGGMAVVLRFAPP